MKQFCFEAFLPKGVNELQLLLFLFFILSVQKYNFFIIIKALSNFF